MRTPRPPATPLAGAVRPPAVPARGSDPRRDEDRPAGHVLPFRRRRGLPVRRRSRLASFARPFVAALAIVGIPAAALWWSATSPRFALAELEVRGSERVSDAWVRDRLAGLTGRNLVWLPLERVERILAAHPWVAGAEVTKELPDRLRVVVLERGPAAILAGGGAGGAGGADGAPGGDAWVDSSGEIIAPVAAADRAPSRGGAEGAPERRTEVLAAALALERALAAVAPRWRRGLEVVRILGPEDFRLEGEALPFALLVRWAEPSGAREKAGDLAVQIRRLERVLPRILSGDLPARLPPVREGTNPPAAVDLRFADRIVIRPAAEEAPDAEEKERGA